jgi:hypothetical protein
MTCQRSPIKARVGDCHVGLPVLQVANAVEKAHGPPAGEREAAGTAMREQVIAGVRVPLQQVPRMIILNAGVKDCDDEAARSGVI